MAHVRIRAAVLTLLSSLIAADACGRAGAEKQAQAPSDAEQLAVDAYVFGYPIVLMDQMRRVMTNVATAGETRAPMGQFANMPNYADPSYRDVMTPSANTFYSVAWIDLRREPYVLSLPDERERYYMMPMLSAWMDVFDSPGARTARTRPRRYVIAGPNWKGLADTTNATFVRAPTNLVWIVGRTFARDTPEDMQAARELQRQYALVPLSARGLPYTPPPGRVDPSIDMKTPIRDQVNALDAATFFTRLAMLMKDNPPAPEDSVIVTQMATIGIVPGQPFDPTKLGADAAAILEVVPRIGIERIMDVEKKLPIVDGWTYSMNLGAYDGQYDFRTYTEVVGLGATLSKDVVSAMTGTDVTEHPLDGSRRYVLHFAKGQQPPVKAFWSVTMYDSNHFFAPNPIHRYEISPKHSPVTFNADGSLDVYIQHEPIVGVMERNWLPSPTGHFYLVMRMHTPTDTVIGGGWKPPGVVENKARR
jgi:hypothetical protein